MLTKDRGTNISLLQHLNRMTHQHKLMQGLIFVQPSLPQQKLSFQHPNMINPPNVSKKKGKNKPKVEPGWGGTINNNPRTH